MQGGSYHPSEEQKGTDVYAEDFMKEYDVYQSLETKRHLQRSF